MVHASGKIPYLPERLLGLERIALNLWWRWHPEARLMLRAIDPVVWFGTRHNPIALLRKVDPARLAACAADPAFLERYDRVMKAFEAAMESSETWFSREHGDAGSGPIAYFCAEFGLHNSIPIYSGGLGVLAGDHCKAASDLGVPLVGVGLLYSKGYFDQKVNLEGWQEGSDEVFDPDIMPLVRLSASDETHSLTVLEVAGRRVHIGAWRLDAGRVSLYLLDTNLPENHPEDRQLTYQLYSGGKEHRLKQEWILGIGGVRVLRALGIEPGGWHANEGHAAFMMVERVRELVADGADLDDAVAQVRARSVFTTHTPVPAGHDEFPPEMVDEIAGDYCETGGIPRERFFSLGLNPGDGEGRFHMTAAAVRLSRYVNGVSRRHGRVTRNMWAPLWPGREGEQVPIGSVTNGVHLGTWMGDRFMELLDELHGPGWQERAHDPTLWDAVLELDDRRVWDIHQALKIQLLDFCREQARRRWKTLWKEAAHLIGSGTLLSPEPLTIGFARRFATYKRANLLFRDEERLRRLLTDPWRPVQIVFAGKAHPADDEGKRLLQRIWASTRDFRFEGRIAFVEDYELHVAHRMVQGVDLWLNVPRVPMEASGTSGMKAALNCVPQLSTIDGWWAEAYQGENGWAIPLAEGDDEAADEQDHDALFTILEREVVPMYYDRDERRLPAAWLRRMKQALRIGGMHYTTGRMVADYAREYYVPALAGSTEGDDPPSIG
jgi:starch phosphorylase